MIQQLMMKYKNQQALNLKGYEKKIKGLVASQLQDEYDLIVLGKKQKVKAVKKEEKKPFGFKDE